MNNSLNSENNELNELKDKKRDLIDSIIDRHYRIKREIRFFLHTIIGLSCSAAVLSITLVEKIGQNKENIWILIVAWIFFGLSIITAIEDLLLFIRRSLKHQKELKLQYKKITLRILNKYSEIRSSIHFPRDWKKNLASPSASFLSILTPTFFFVLGIIFLGIFWITNLHK